MDSEIIEKWFAYWRPLQLGLTSDGQANALTLTLGVFWARCRGGYNLYRWVGDRRPSQPGRIVGAAAAGSLRISSFPYVGHEPSTIYWYLLRAVGGGGVEETTGHQIRRAEFDADGEYVGPHPNPPRMLQVEPILGGRIRLRWSYDPTDEEVAPGRFLIHNDAGTPGVVDYETVVGSVDYAVGRPLFEWTSEVFPDGARVWWVVRSESPDGVVEDNAVSLATEADASGPAVHTGVTASRTDDMS
ncbi:MAG: hypothetical protein JXQ73_17655 [Phycisphaerae bacterium]|nr:hypothetical protein [Phycisphaerae bacterium]